MRCRLFRILDWCKANHADVFLQQMWGTLPGMRTVAYIRSGSPNRLTTLPMESPLFEVPDRRPQIYLHQILLHG
ncbi:MAG: hypothetical protein U5K79_07560 [Cyclobacteriaceae bacterium]|nr:hypothetical protein [Cyclobacteriaceae bacterium]